MLSRRTVNEVLLLSICFFGSNSIDMQHKVPVLVRATLREDQSAETT